MALGGLFVVEGLYIDGHAHVFEPVETFFTPWHAMMYGGALFAVIVFGSAIAINMRRGYSLWNAVPNGYQQTLVAIPALFIGGGLDLIWHETFGIEQQLDTLVSPTHMIIISAMFFIFAGPLRAGLIRFTSAPSKEVVLAPSLFAQLPMLISMAVSIGAILFVTQMAFYPEALMIDKPLPVQAGAYSEDQLTIIITTYYRHILGTLVIVWQSLLLAGSALYLLLNARLRPGALLIYAVLEKAMISFTLSRSMKELVLVTLSSIAGGLIAEFIAARYAPSWKRPNAVRAFGFFVPLTFYSAYFAFAVPFFGGTWWDPSFLFGAIAYAGLAGILISQAFIGGFNAKPNTA